MYVPNNTKLFNPSPLMCEQIYTLFCNQLQYLTCSNIHCQDTFASLESQKETTKYTLKTVTICFLSKTLLLASNICNLYNMRLGSKIIFRTQTYILIIFQLFKLFKL